jgi:RNA polymerase sigma-70 factor, ECF subfamily
VSHQGVQELRDLRTSRPHRPGSGPSSSTAPGTVFRREAAGIDETPIEDVDQISLYRRIAEEDPFPYSDSVHVDFLHSFSDHDVWEVLDRLKPKYRVPLVLVHMEGMTTREVADLLETPLNTLLSWLHRGRKHFEAELWEYARSHGLLKRKDQAR